MSGGNGKLPEPYYQDDWATIYHGDCRDILPLLPKVDLVLTDPPYGVGESYDKFMDDERVVGLVKEVLDLANCELFVMTPGNKRMFMYPEPTACGCFYYPAGSGMCNWGFIGWQPIFFYGADPYLKKCKGSLINSFSSSELSEKNGHPCPKPIGQWKWLLNRTSFEGETVLDPFMGSGTTLRAAKDLKRKSIGIEISEEYCSIAKKRLCQEVLI